MKRESWKRDRTERCVSWSDAGRGGRGDLARVSVQLPLSPSTSGGQDAPSSRMGSYDMLREQSVSPVPATSQIHSDLNSQPAKVLYFGAAYPEPCHAPI